MVTRRQSDEVDLDRRAVLMLGLAGASALVIDKHGGLMAAERGKEEGIERRVFKEVESMIPGFPKVRLRETRFHPGASNVPRSMPNPMICECSEGALEVTQDGRTFTVQQGDIWTCNIGTREGAANKGTTPATMRILDLLPA